MKLNLIASSSSFFEINWIRECLKGIEVREHIRPALDLFLDDAIYIISADHNPPRDLPRLFFQGLQNIERKGVLHISDEFLRGPYTFYAEFDFVIRQYYSSHFECRGVMTVPLGYTNELKRDCLANEARNRPNIWSFAGKLTTARERMLREFRLIGPNECFCYDGRNTRQTPLTKSAYREMLSNSIFCPCPMGNVVLETYRTYEALEMGCIPIVEHRPFMDYYARLMPGHPMPSFASWRSASDFVREIMRDIHAVSQLQQEISAWWVNYKSLLQARITEFIGTARSHSFREDLTRWSSAERNSFASWRTLELLKHTTPRLALDRGLRSLACRWSRAGS
jgi:hypothetical protein